MSRAEFAALKAEVLERLSGGEALARIDALQAEVARLTAALFDRDTEAQRLRLANANLTALCAEHERTIATAARVAAGGPVDEGARIRCSDCMPTDGAGPHAPANPSNSSTPAPAADTPPRAQPARAVALPRSDARHPEHAAWVRERGP